MTSQEFKSLKRRLEKLLAKAEDEALAGGVPITSPKFQEILLKIKEHFLLEANISLEDYDLAELEAEAEDIKIREEEKEILKRMPSGPMGPKGDRGDRGEVGPFGPEGKMGPKGDRGDKGDVGPMGMKGDVGLEGKEGKQGPQGPQGKQGPKGETSGVEEFKKGLALTKKEFEQFKEDLTRQQAFQSVGSEGGGSSNVGDFTDLGDVPNSYATHGGEVVSVKATEDGLEFTVGGATGPQGTQGFQGPQGPQGNQGCQGSQGYQGTVGSQGPQGYQGVQGGLGAGSQGTQGFQGPQGPQGVQGFQGSQGYQGSQGFQGPQGTQGYQGPQGRQGGQGGQGFQGPQGVQGFQGSQGYQGPQGVQGWQGPQGIQGYQGVQGYQGTQGCQGTQGFQGPIGPKNTGQIFLSSAGGWAATTSGCSTNILYELAAGQPNVYLMNFTASTSNQFADWDCVMPSDWNEGTVSAYPYWTSSAFGVNIGVVWSIRGRSFANDDALGQAWGNVVSASMSGGTSNDLYIGSSLIVGVSGAGANELCCFEIGRWPSAVEDSLTAAASLLGCRIDYTRT